MVAEHSRGFIYYISLTGTTGVRSQLAEGLSDKVAYIKQKRRTMQAALVLEKCFEMNWRTCVGRLLPHKPCLLWSMLDETPAVGILWENESGVRDGLAVKDKERGHKRTQHVMAGRYGYANLQGDSCIHNPVPQLCSGRHSDAIAVLMQQDWFHSVLVEKQTNF